jgi:hypothetical protein
VEGASWIPVITGQYQIADIAAIGSAHRHAKAPRKTRIAVISLKTAEISFALAVTVAVAEASTKMKDLGRDSIVTNHA